MKTRSVLVLAVIWAATSPPGLASTTRKAQAILLNPTTLSIAGPAGGPNPAPSTLTVQNSGTGKLNWSATTSDPWLTVNPTAGTLHASESIGLSVSVDLTTAGAGTRTATITVSDPGASNSPQTCAVTVLVSSGARIGLSPASVSMTAPLGGPDPPGQSVAIQNTGGGSLAWSATFSPSWLSGSVSSGTLAAGASQTLTLSASVSGLTAGSYSGSMTVTSAGASNSPQSMSVTLAISQAPVISLDSTSLTFDAPLGGANPAAQSLVLRNAGGGTLAWSASTAAGWLFVNPASGSLSPGSMSTLSVSVNTASLAAGTYMGSLSFAAPGASNTPQAVSVVLNVNSLPKIGINPNTVSFSVASDTGQSSPSAVAVTNTGSGTLVWTASTSAPWLNSSPAGGSLPALVSEPLFLSVSPAGMAPGHYTATVQVQDANATNSSQTVAVDLVVAESSLPVHAPAGQCGLLGLEALLPWLYLNHRRRLLGGTPP